MTPAWAQRQKELLRDCVVAPDVFHHMVDRLGEFVMPYQHALETEAGQRNVHLYLQGLLSHLPRKNAEDIATMVDVERLVLHEFIGTALWDHRPLVRVLVGQVVNQVGEPDGIVAFDPSSFPKRGTHSVGVKRQWCSHRGKVDTRLGGLWPTQKREEYRIKTWPIPRPLVSSFTAIVCVCPWRGPAITSCATLYPLMFTKRLAEGWLPGGALETGWKSG
jgi:hypothetical protein